MVNTTAPPRLINVPGIDGSDENHWQSHWEDADPSIERFEPASWTYPEVGAWMEAVGRAVVAVPGPAVLVAHSLGTLAATSWAAKFAPAPVVGLVLVSVPDPEGQHFPGRAEGFELAPGPLQVPAILLASDNDPYAPLAHQRSAAAMWGAAFIELGSLGHVSSASNLGSWQHGRDLVRAFCAGLSPRTNEARGGLSHQPVLTTALRH